MAVFCVVRQINFLVNFNPFNQRAVPRFSVSNPNRQTGRLGFDVSRALQIFLVSIITRTMLNPNLHPAPSEYLSVHL